MTDDMNHCSERMMNSDKTGSPNLAVCMRGQARKMQFLVTWLLIWTKIANISLVRSGCILKLPPYSHFNAYTLCTLPKDMLNCHTFKPVCINFLHKNME